ncbi:MAG: glycogen synthase [Acholeplasmataceae bacterium]
MKILFCSGEAHPFSKTGGLADVMYMLPKALKQLGHDVKIMTPLYQNIKKDDSFIHLGSKIVRMDDHIKKATYYLKTYDGLDYVFIENNEFFDRIKYYNYEDDAMRFTFFNFAVLESLKAIDFSPDIIHLNDWQTGMIPFLLHAHYLHDPFYKKIKTLLSIHNLEKQGAFALDYERLFNAKNYTYIHFDQVNFLKSGIMRADAINTVSESYKEEAMTKFYGFSLEGALKSRKHQLFGILNGLDQSLYNPQTSEHLKYHYDEKTFIEGKKNNKHALLETLNMDNDKPLIAFIGRFARQKGIDLMMAALESFLKNNHINLIAIGKGDRLYETYFERLEDTYPHSVKVIKGFDFALSQHVYAASDFFLMPSLFEPCGLNHMIAMRYGSLPIVRRTGGLKDTVTPYNPNTGIGCGFSFENYDANELSDVLNQAITLFHEDKESINHLIEQAMHVNYSLPKMAKSYEDLYQKLINHQI